MQQEQIVLNVGETSNEVVQQTPSRGPMVLSEDMLAWVSGGIGETRLPNGTW